MHCIVSIDIILSYRPEQEMQQRHNDDTKDEETISYVDPHDTETTDERDMILNTYGDTAGYVSSRNINISLILTFPYNICKVSYHDLMFF